MHALNLVHIRGSLTLDDEVHVIVVVIVVLVVLVVVVAAFLS